MAMTMDVGTIVWARLSTYVYWPAIVYPRLTENDNGNFFHSAVACNNFSWLFLYIFLNHELNPFLFDWFVRFKNICEILCQQRTHSSSVRKSCHALRRCAGFPRVRTKVATKESGIGSGRKNGEHLFQSWLKHQPIELRGIAVVFKLLIALWYCRNKWKKTTTANSSPKMHFGPKP